MSCFFPINLNNSLFSAEFMVLLRSGCLFFNFSTNGHVLVSTLQSYFIAYEAAALHFSVLQFTVNLHRFYLKKTR